MKFLVDVDGVLLDWDKAFTVWALQRGYELRNPYAYDLESRFGINGGVAIKLCVEFNSSADIGFLYPYKDSVHGIKSLHESLGAMFTVISSVSSNHNSRKLRTMNLQNLFGNVFDDFIYLPCGAPKIEVLSSFRYDSCYWFEDKPENAEAGNSLGFNTFLFNHPYNKHVTVSPDIRRVDTWADAMRYIA